MDALAQHRHSSTKRVDTFLVDPWVNISQLTYQHTHTHTHTHTYMGRGEEGIEGGVCGLGLRVFIIIFCIFSFFYLIIFGEGESESAKRRCAAQQREQASSLAGH